MTGRESLVVGLLNRIENPPKPTDGPDFHAEYDFWREGIRRELDVLISREKRLSDALRHIVSHVESDYPTYPPFIVERAKDALHGR